MYLAWSCCCCWLRLLLAAVAFVSTELQMLELRLPPPPGTPLPPPPPPPPPELPLAPCLPPIWNGFYLPSPFVCRFSRFCFLSPLSVSVPIYLSLPYYFFYMWLNACAMATNVDSKFHSYLYWFRVDFARWFSICLSDAHCCSHCCVPCYCCPWHCCWRYCLLADMPHFVRPAFVDCCRIFSTEYKLVSLYACVD